MNYFYRNRAELGIPNFILHVHRSRLSKCCNTCRTRFPQISQLYMTWPSPWSCQFLWAWRIFTLTYRTRAANVSDIWETLNIPTLSNRPEGEREGRRKHPKLTYLDTYYFLKKRRIYFHLFTLEFSYSVLHDLAL